MAEAYGMVMEAVASNQEYFDVHCQSRNLGHINAQGDADRLAVGSARLAATLAVGRAAAGPAAAGADVAADDRAMPPPSANPRASSKTRVQSRERPGSVDARRGKGGRSSRASSRPPPRGSVARASAAAGPAVRGWPPIECRNCGKVGRWGPPNRTLQGPLLQRGVLPFVEGCRCGGWPCACPAWRGWP